jgi:hypothetical protein
MTSKILRPLSIAALLVTFGAAESSASTVRLSARGGLDLDWISALKTAVTLDCDGRPDADTRAMMQALERQGGYRRYERRAGREGGDQLVASRSGQRFYLHAKENDGGGVKIEMPWPVARCLFGGREAPAKLDLRSLRQPGAFVFQVEDGNSHFSIDLDLR